MPKDNSDLRAGRKLARELSESVDQLMGRIASRNEVIEALLGGAESSIRIYVAGKSIDVKLRHGDGSLAGDTGPLQAGLLRALRWANDRDASRLPELASEIASTIRGVL